MFSGKMDRDELEKVGGTLLREDIGINERRESMK